MKNILKRKCNSCGKEDDIINWKIIKDSKGLNLYKHLNCKWISPI